MNRHPLLPALLITLAWVLACGRNSPKYFIETEGREEVIGGPGVAKTTSQIEAEREAAERGEVLTKGGSGAGLQTPNTRVVEADPGEGLPPVADSYEHLAGAAEITSCPEGARVEGSPRTDREQHCVLENGVRHGPFMLWHNNGKLKEVGPYVGGKRHGTVVSYGRDGAKYSVYTWENGAPTSGQVFK